MEKISVRKFANKLTDSGTKTIYIFSDERSFVSKYSCLLVKYETRRQDGTQYRRNVALAAYKQRFTEKHKENLHIDLKRD
jgi:hypothetical protein